jgi:hypothetical protein
MPEWFRRWTGPVLLGLVQLILPALGVPRWLMWLLGGILLSWAWAAVVTAEAVRTRVPEAHRLLLATGMPLVLLMVFSHFAWQSFPKPDPFRVFKSAASTEATWEFRVERNPLLLGNCPRSPCFRINVTEWNLEAARARIFVWNDHGGMPSQIGFAVVTKEGCWAEYLDPKASIAVRVLVLDARVHSLRAWVGVVEAVRWRPPLPTISPRAEIISHGCGAEQLLAHLDRMHGIVP